MNTNIDITDKLINSQKSSKTELAHFKKLLELSRSGLGNFALYSTMVKRTWIYRSLFTMISLLFFYLAIAIHPKSITWTASLLFGSLLSTKTLIVSGCVAIGTISLLIALSLNPVKELVRSKVAKAYRELWKTHEERKLKKRIPWITSCKEKLHLKSVLYHLYRDVCDKIEDSSKETIALVFSIEKREKMTLEYKERLIEQTLDEFDHILEDHLHNFSSSWIEEA